MVDSFTRRYNASWFLEVSDKCKEIKRRDCDQERGANRDYRALFNFEAKFHEF
jgi:hypothetical protein